MVSLPSRRVRYNAWRRIVSPPPCLAVRRCSKALVRVHRQQTAQLAALSILWDRVDDERVTAAAEARRAVDVAAAQTKGPQAPAPTHY